MPLIWEALIVIATWPAFERLKAWLGGRHGLTVAAMAVAILLIIIVPIPLAVVTIAGYVADISERVGSLSTLAQSAAPDRVSRIPLAGEKIATRCRAMAALNAEDRTAAIAPYVKTAAEWPLAPA